MATIKHQIGIDGPVDNIFSALTTNDGFTGWWASSADVRKKTGGHLVLVFETLAVLKFEYLEIQENQKIHLKCLEGPGPWPDSELMFNLTQTADQVFLSLTHQNNLASDDDFLYFNTKWVCYLLSLKNWVETGKGQPYPNDVKIHMGD